MRIFKYLLLSFLVVGSAFGAGLDSDTKLYISGDEDTMGATTVDGALEVLDSGNTGRIITQVSTAKLTTAITKFGTSSLSLNGTSDYVTIPDSADWILGGGTGDFTIDGWVYTDATTPSSLEQIIGQRTEGLNQWILYANGDSISWQVDSSTGSDESFTATLEWVAETWYHIAVVRKGTTSGDTMLFVNGVSQSFTDSPTVWDYTIPNIAAPVQIGKIAALGYYWGGNIAHMRIQDEAIWTANFDVPTVAPVADANTVLLLQMDTQDQSGDGGSDAYHIPDFIGTAQLDTGQKLSADDYSSNTSSWLGDGNSDYISIPDSSDFDIASSNSAVNLIDFWVRENGAISASAGIFKHGDNVGTNSLNLTSFSGVLYFDAVTGGSLDFRLTTAPTVVFTANTWHHVMLAIIGDGSTKDMAIFVDGDQEAYLQDADVVNWADTFFIGRYATYYWDGNIAHFRIQNSNDYDITVASADPGGDWMDDTGSNLGTITVPTAPYTAASGWTHIINQVLNANLAKINGTAKASVAYANQT